MYTGLGIEPVAAASIAMQVSSKIGSLLGGTLSANVKLHSDELAAHYSAALNGDSTALQWLYEKSGGLDSGSINFNNYTGKGWAPKDFQGSLASALIYAVGFRRATYEYYMDAAAKAGQPVLASGTGANMVRLNNVDTPTYQSTNPVKLLTVAPPPIHAPEVQRASLFGMDVGSPATLASLGFIALAFILRDR